MTQSDQFDILILGSGAGGKVLAWDMAKSGQRVAVVERQWIGGSCPNVACLPSKNAISSARIAHMARQAGWLGMGTGPHLVDMTAVRGRKRAMVDRLVAAHRQEFDEAGVELVMGSGRFLAARTIEVRLNDGGTRTLGGKKVFINVGTHAIIPDIPGLSAAQPLTHVEALELDRVPSHLIVLGGGYVGVEFAQAYRRFGSKVTIVEPSGRLMSREDADVAAELQQIVVDEGIAVLTDTSVRSVHGLSGDAVALTVRTGARENVIEGSDILVAAGRAPNTQGIGLEEAGITLDDRGYIRVSDRLETSVADVWAIGECAGSPQFTHASAYDSMIIKVNLAGGSRSTRDRIVPHCMFTDPPLARVGLAESEAQRQGISVRIAKMPVSAVLRTHATGETRGLMKALVHASDDRILGFTMLGAEAGEVMTAVQIAMLAGLPYQTVRDAVIAHPTMAEGLGLLFAAVPAAAGR